MTRAQVRTTHLGLLRRAGLPQPRTQVIHRRDGKTYARVDFMFDEQAIVVEVSGRKGHTSPSERARDASRRNELQDVGRLVYEYTWEHVTRQGDMWWLTRCGPGSPHADTTDSSSLRWSPERPFP